MQVSLRKVRISLVLGASALALSACVNTSNLDWDLRAGGGDTSTAARTKSANSGCGAKGFDLSSGWNCTPRNQGWSCTSTMPMDGSITSGSSAITSWVMRGA